MTARKRPKKEAPKPGDCEAALPSAQKVALFYNVTRRKADDHLTIEDAMALVKEEAIADKIEAVRRHYAKWKKEKSAADEEQYQTAKKALPAISVSCDLKTRSAQVNQQSREIVPTGLLQVDIDDAQDPAAMRDRLGTLPWIFSAFISPSGNGVKGIAVVGGAGAPEYHARAVRALDDALARHLGVRNDPAVKDLTRLCFLSADKDAIINQGAVPLVSLDSTELPVASAQDVQDYSSAPSTAGHGDIVRGERNHALFRLGLSHRRDGMEDSRLYATLTAVNAEQCKPPLDDAEVQQIARSCCKYPAEKTVPMAAVPDPEELPLGLPPVPPFCLEWLPNSAQGFVQDCSERMSVPPDYCAVSLMCCMGGVLGNRIAVRPKKNDDDWVEIANLWAAIIGASSSLKSASLNQSRGFVHDLEREGREDHRLRVAEYEADSEAHKVVAAAVKDHIRSAAKKRLKAGEDTPIEADCARDELLRLSGREPIPPSRRRLMINDATIEKLLELLAENPRGIIQFRDELVGFLRSMEKDGHEQDRAFYLEAFSGKAPFVCDRIGRGTIEADCITVSILGGIQPGPFASYLSSAARGGAADDGFVQRFQLMVYPDPPRTFVRVDRKPDHQAALSVSEVFSRLSSLEPETVGATHVGRFPALGFTPKAQIIWDNWHETLMNRCRKDDMPAILSSFLIKQTKTCATMALLLHLADGGMYAIPPESLRKAIEWCKYLEGHAKRVLHQALCPELIAADALKKRILAGQVKDGFTLKDIYRNGWSLLGTHDSAQSAITTLIDYGWLLIDDNRHEKAGPGRSPGPRYKINPKVRKMRSSQKTAPPKPPKCRRKPTKPNSGGFGSAVSGGSAGSSKDQDHE